eukprot:2867961-Pyramimonas_sp.AAC.1
MKKRLSDLGLQVSCERELLIERLRECDRGNAMVKKGCSVARTARSSGSGASMQSPGEDIKCGDCGKCGRRGGGVRCPLCAEMKHYRRIETFKDGINDEMNRDTPSKPKCSGSSAASSASSARGFLDEEHRAHVPRLPRGWYEAKYQQDQRQRDLRVPEILHLDEVQ